MVKRILTISLGIVVIISFKDPAQKSFQKVLTNDHYNFISINNIMMWIGNNGDGSHDPQTDGNGFYWPGGTKAIQSAIFDEKNNKTKQNNKEYTTFF